LGVPVWKPFLNFLCEDDVLAMHFSFRHSSICPNSPLHKQGLHLCNRYGSSLHLFDLYSSTSIPLWYIWKGELPYLATSDRLLIRPVPVVLRLLAFSLHSYFRTLAAGYPQLAQVCFWMCRLRRPHLRQRVCVLLCLFPKELVPLVILTV